MAILFELPEQLQFGERLKVRIYARQVRSKVMHGTADILPLEIEYTCADASRT
jgi:hypothetical protein